MRNFDRIGQNAVDQFVGYGGVKVLELETGTVWKLTPKKIEAGIDPHKVTILCNFNPAMANFETFSGMAVLACMMLLHVAADPFGCPRL